MGKKKMELVKEQPDTEDLQMSPKLTAFISELLQEHLDTLPPSVVNALSAEDKEEWAILTQSVVEDGVTSLIEKTIAVLESDFVDDGEDDDDDDDDNEEDDPDQ